MVNGGVVDGRVVDGGGRCCRRCTTGWCGGRCRSCFGLGRNELEVLREGGRSLAREPYESRREEASRSTEPTLLWHPS